MSAQPPSWPVRILIAAGAVPAILILAVTLAVAIAVTTVLGIAQDVARTILRLPPVQQHRANCRCQRCTHPRPLTRRERRAFDAIRSANTDLAVLTAFGGDDEW